MTQYYLLMPEIVLLALGILSFCYGFIKRNYLHTWILGFISVSIATVMTVAFFSYEEFSAGLIRINIYNQLIRLLVYVAGLFVIALSYEEFKNQLKRAEEYVFLMILALFGMNIMIIANDLLVLYLGLETFSLALYVLVGFYRENRLSIEAGLKYFILGTVSSIVLLGSIIFFYAITGSTSYEAFKIIKGGEFASLLALVFLISAFAFKLSLAPFHAWAPDVYQGAPTPVTALLSTAPKVAVFGSLINIIPIISKEMSPQGYIVILSVLSMLIGNLLALRQRDLKRMFAYSTIAHSGYMFMAFLLAEHSIIASLIPYLVAYIVMNIGAFAFILAVKGGENIGSYYGLGSSNPLFAFSILIILFSLTGIPPTAGFIVKLNLFKNVFSAGYSGIVFFALLMSILSAFYYLRIVFYLYRNSYFSFEQKNSQLPQSIAFVSSAFLLLTGVIPKLILII